MRTLTRPKLSTLFAVVAILALTVTGSAGATAPLTTLSADEAIAQIQGEDGVLRFDMAENATNFAWAGEPELSDGMPVHRTAVLSQGYLYPAGTLTESSGVLPDGSPEFPDKVLGQFSCWGWYLGTDAVDGAPLWLNTHLFSFGGVWGEATLVSQGYSIDAMDDPIARAVTGGTGPYAASLGILTETNLGFNASHGVNSRYEVRLAGQ